MLERNGTSRVRGNALHSRLEIWQTSNTMERRLLEFLGYSNNNCSCCKNDILILMKTGNISKIVFRLLRMFQCCLRIFFFFYDERASKTRFFFYIKIILLHLTSLQSYIQENWSNKVMLGYPIIK